MHTAKTVPRTLHTSRLLRLPLVVALILCTSPSVATDLVGRATSVADGDTITVTTPDRARHRIRLDGIDAPERTQPYSQISRKNLLAMVDGQQVTVTSSKTDRFGRVVGIVRTERLHDVGLEQIKAGLAWHFKRYESEQTPENRASYAAAEGIAKAARLGLWRDPEPVPPWEFRAKLQTPAMERP